MPSPSTRQVLQNLGLVFAGTCVAFLLAEVSLRLYGHLIDFDHLIASREIFNSNRLPAEIFSHADSGERDVPLRPHTKGLGLSSDFSVLYEINQFGMRDRHYELSPDPSSLRMLALGDSYTFGEGVPDRGRFTEIAENHFGNIEFLNFGVPGYGLDQTLALFHYHGARFAPDLVILFMAATLPSRIHMKDLVVNGEVNFPPATSPRPATYDNSGGTIYIARDSSAFRLIDNVFIRNSHFLSFLYQKLQLWMLLEKLEKTDNLEWNGMTNPDNDSQDATEFVSSPEVVQRSKAIIGEFKKKCDEMNARFVIVNIDAAVTFPFIPGLIGPENYFDYADELSALAQAQPLRFKYDQHYNPETHKSIAQWLVDDLDPLVVAGTHQ